MVKMDEQRRDDIVVFGVASVAILVWLTAVISGIVVIIHFLHKWW